MSFVFTCTLFGFIRLFLFAFDYAWNVEHLKFIDFQTMRGKVMRFIALIMMYVHQRLRNLLGETDKLNYTVAASRAPLADAVQFYR